MDPRPEPEKRRRTTNRRKVGAFAMAAAIGLVAFACRPGTDSGQDATIPADETTTVAQETLSGPFFLDLATGEETPLAEDLAGGYAYVASPDGTRLAYGTSRGGGCADTDVLTIANTDGTDASSVEAPEGLIACGARWSPDGSKLVYQLRKGSGIDVGNLFIHDLASGQRTRLTDLELTKASWWFLSPSFSPDGENVIFHLPRSSSETTTWDVWSVPATGGEPTLVLQNGAFPVYFPLETEIAFVLPAASNLGGSTLAIASADGRGSRRTLVEGNGIWWPTMSPDGSRIAYQDESSIYVVDASTGESSEVANGNLAEWLDDDTLIVSPA